MQFPLDVSSQDESSGDDSSLILNRTEQRTQAPKRIRGTPLYFLPKTFTNETEKDKEVPEKRCAVCCKLLYPEDCCKLSLAHKTRIENMFPGDRRNALEHGATVDEIEKITWPLLNYRDYNGEQIRNVDIHYPKGKGEEYVIVCARHKSSGAKSLNTIMDYVS